MELSVILNILLGVYGLGLTTYTVIRSNKEKRRRLNITFSCGFPAHGPDLGPYVLFITVSNPGDRKVTINVPHIELPDGKLIVTPYPLSNVTFPYELEEGKNCLIWVEMKELKRILTKREYTGTVKLRAKVSDGTGKVYKSKKKWDFDVGKDFD